MEERELFAELYHPALAADRTFGLPAWWTAMAIVSGGNRKDISLPASDFGNL
jgi:hypothetical protein